MNKELFLLLTIVFLSGLSCAGDKSQFKSQEELKEYVSDPEHGFVHSFNLNKLDLSVMIIPPIGNDESAHFEVRLRISSADGSAVLKLNNSINDNNVSKESYLSFGILKDLYFVDDNGIHSANFHHYERNYGLKNSIDLGFEFPYFEPKGEVRLVYRDELFGQGLATLKIKNHLLNKRYVD